MPGNENLFARDYLIAGPVVMGFRNLLNFCLVTGNGIIAATRPNVRLKLSIDFNRFKAGNLQIHFHLCQLQLSAISFLCYFALKFTSILFVSNLLIFSSVSSSVLLSYNIGFVLFGKKFKWSGFKGLLHWPTSCAR